MKKIFLFLLLPISVLSQTDTTFYPSQGGLKRELNISEMRSLIGSAGGGSESTTVSSAEGVQLSLSGSNITPALGNTYMLNQPEEFTAGRKLNWGAFTSYIGTDSDSTVIVFDGANNRVSFGGAPLADVTMYGTVRVQSGTLILPSGSDAAPGFAFSSGTSTGVRYDGGRLGFVTGSVQRMNAGSTGVSIVRSNLAASAHLHIGGGTATPGTAPLKFTSGTNLTTPEAGAVEWDGSRMYLTQTSGLTRQTVAYLGDVPDNITDLTISSTVDFSSNRITGLANAQVSSDAVNKTQLDSLGTVLNNSHALDIIAGTDGDTIVLDTRETLLVLDGALGDPATFYIDGSALSSGAKLYIKYGGFSGNATIDRDDDNDPGNFLGVSTTSGSTTLTYSGTGFSCLLKSGATWYEMY